MSESTKWDYKKYLNCLRDEEYIALYNYYSKETMMDILGVSRQENPHSSFLRWLLDVNSDHGCGTIPMRKLLETVCLFREKVYFNKSDSQCDNNINDFWKTRDNLFGKNKGNEVEEIKYGRYEIVNQFIANEIVLKNQRRADIFGILKIRMQNLKDNQNNDNSIRYLVFIIENKVTSKENNADKGDNSQTNLYAKDLNDDNNLRQLIKKQNIDWIDIGEDKEKEKIIKLFLFLNPFSTADIKKALRENGKNEVQIANSKEFISLNYQYLLDGVIEPIANIVSDGLVKQRIQDYIRCLGQSKITPIKESANTDDDDEYLIMAISKREKQIAIDLWKKYHSIINPILESIYKNDNNDSFLIGERDKGLWISLANLYRLIEEKDFKIALNDKDSSFDKVDADILSDLKDLKDIVMHANSVSNSRRHKFVFKNIEYISYTSRSIGVLCRDIIADFIKKQENMHVIVNENWIEELRLKMQKWNENWLREVILFDFEVEQLQKNDGSYNSSNSKYKTESIKEFAESFFSYMDVVFKKDKRLLDYKKEELEDEYKKRFPKLVFPLEIKLNNGQKLYVAKFWTAASVDKLIGLLDNDYACDYKKMVKKYY